MSRDRASRRLPVIITLIVGLMLTIMPLPEAAAVFRPDWLALLLYHEPGVSAPRG
jgi:rod shape-determining protein MreD